MGTPVTLDTLPEVLDLAQLCAVLGISKKTWQRWRRCDAVPVPELLPATSHPRYSKAMVVKYLNRGRTVTA